MNIFPFPCGSRLARESGVPFDEEALIQHLQTFGLNVDKAAERFGVEGKGLSLYCFDSDGNQVELKGPSVV